MGHGPVRGGSDPPRDQRRRITVGRTSRNRDGPIDFRWEGLIEDWPDGQLSFSMNGEALSAFSYGRIGLCALHDELRLHGVSPSSPGIARR